ncbi:MAG: hypothetical protein HPY57_15700 [Ignavibacteria bacterium]|nr:hypothetical protein [Ignavibacteria bacterium]
MKRYTNFILEKNKPILKYYAFDWDDNILIMPTKIHMEKKDNGHWVPVDVSTEEFSKVRKLDNWRTIPGSFSDFRDNGPRGRNAFIEDVKIAIKNKQFGPSWNKFIECLMKGSIFAIITARGHEPDTIREAVEWIIWNAMNKEERTEMGANLTAFQDLFVQNFDILRQNTFKTLVSGYLDNCDFVGISSPSFINKYKITSDSASPEQSKLKALNEFINKVKKYANIIDGETRIGFSDDDSGNVKTIKKYFGEISSLYNDVKFSIYDTSNKKAKKINIA